VKIGRDVSTPENQAWWDRVDHVTRGVRDEMTELARDIEAARRMLGCPLVDRICNGAEAWLRHQERIYGSGR